jgi:hypothetical protein
MSPRWTFGEKPLAQTLRLAGLVRRVTSTALSLEEEDPAVERLIGCLEDADHSLARVAPADLAPRVGARATPDQRVYLDHSRAIGEYNPCFPEYEISVEGESAHGTVSFPLAYEGPPGLVHGGFIALFFDCAIQHHNCDLGVAGKTTSLDLSYRRPTPVLVNLDFEIQRSSDGRRITSRAQLSARGSLLCEANMEAVASDRSSLPDVSPRRSDR